VILNLFLRLAYAWHTPGVRQVRMRPVGVRQALHGWLSALQLGVLKLAGGVAEWVLRYSSNH